MTGMMVSLKKLVIASPEQKVEELVKALHAQGFTSATKSSVSTIRADFLHSCRVLSEVKDLDLAKLAATSKGKERSASAMAAQKKVVATDADFAPVEAAPQPQPEAPAQEAPVVELRKSKKEKAVA